MAKFVHLPLDKVEGLDAMGYFLSSLTREQTACATFGDVLQTATKAIVYEKRQVSKFEMEKVLMFVGCHLTDFCVQIVLTKADTTVWDLEFSGQIRENESGVWYGSSVQTHANAKKAFKRINLGATWLKIPHDEQRQLLFQCGPLPMDEEDSVLFPVAFGEDVEFAHVVLIFCDEALIPEVTIVQLLGRGLILWAAKRFPEIEKAQNNPLEVSLCCVLTSCHCCAGGRGAREKD